MKQVLVVCHSQTGQLRHCVESLVAPLTASGEVSVEYLEPTPVVPYPFPWSVGEFLDVMPESALQVAPPLRPMKPRAQRYDLIVLAYQVWYLAPALPMTGFLASPTANLLRDTPILALCACRNMWQAAWRIMKERITALGGRVIGHVVLVDQGPAWATFVTTPRWLWTGRRDAFGPFPAAGVSDEAIAGLRPLSERLLAAIQEDRLDASVFSGLPSPPLVVNRRFVIPELLAREVFVAWANVIRRAGRGWRGLRRPLEALFLAWLATSIVGALPLVALATPVVRLVGRAWFEARVAELASPPGGVVR